MSTPQSLPDTRPLVPLSRGKLILSMTILYLLFASDLWARVGINALLPVLQKDLLLTDIQIGMLGSAVLIGMISFVLPASYLADKWSRRGTVCLMGLTWSIGTILCGLVPSMAMLVLGRFLVGGGNSSYAPASVAMLTNWFPKKSWGRVIGLYNTSDQIGISGGLIVTGYLAAAYGWRTTFVIIGIPSLILALTALLIPAGPAKTTATVAKVPRVSVREALSVILKNRTLMSTALATTFFNMTATSFIMFTSIYFMREMKEEGMVRSHPDFRVCVDSPLANEATRIYSGNLHGYLDEEAIEALKGGALFQFPGLTLTETSEESKALNLDTSSKVIISASGMCDAGRIRHHLKHTLWRKECTVVFVGYQAEGSLGRALLEGAKSVKLFGEEIAVNARIVNFKGLSSHADRDHLLAWIEHFAPTPQQVFVVHGDSEVTDLFAKDLNERSIPAHAPLYEEVYDLSANAMLAKVRLQDVSKQLEALISRSRGRPNKDLARLADQIKQVMENWEN